MSALLATLPAPVEPPSDEELESEIMQLAAQISAATFQLLMLIAEFDARQACCLRGETGPLMVLIWFALKPRN